MGILVDAVNFESKGQLLNYFKDNTSELYNLYGAIINELSTKGRADNFLKDEPYEYESEEEDNSDGKYEEQRSFKRQKIGQYKKSKNKKRSKKRSKKHKKPKKKSKNRKRSKRR